jgi:hypothetical protein
LPGLNREFLTFLRHDPVPESSADRSIALTHRQDPTDGADPDFLTIPLGMKSRVADDCDFSDFEYLHHFATSQLSSFESNYDP